MAKSSDTKSEKKPTKGQKDVKSAQPKTVPRAKSDMPPGSYQTR